MTCFPAYRCSEYYYFFHGCWEEVVVVEEESFSSRAYQCSEH
jgi:hypothetical protein